MAGAIIIIVVLVLTPVAIGMSAIAAAGLLGQALHRNAAAEHAGSELIDSNY